MKNRLNKRILAAGLVMSVFTAVGVLTTMVCVMGVAML